MPVLERVSVILGVLVPLGVCVTDAEVVTLGDSDMLGDPLGLGVDDTDADCEGDPDTDAVALTLGLAVSLGDAEPLGVCVSLAVWERVCV